MHFRVRTQQRVVHACQRSQHQLAQCRKLYILIVVADRKVNIVSTDNFDHVQAELLYKLYVFCFTLQAVPHLNEFDYVLTALLKHNQAIQAPSIELQTTAAIVSKLDQQ